MIYLIGGSPRWGKTTLAQKLSKELSIPYLSTDYFRLMMIPYFSWEEKDVRFPFEKMENQSGIIWLYRDHSGKELLDADLHEADFLWTGISVFITHLMICRKDYIIEGVHFLPRLISQYRENKDIKSLILTKTDDQKILHWLRENRNNGDWIADNIKDDATLWNAAKCLAEYGKYFEDESKKYDLPFLSTEDDFFRTLDHAIELLKQ